MPPKATPAPCPSEQAYRRHLRRGESPCEGCRQAHRDYGAGQRPKPAQGVQPECGTTAGYRWHRSHDEPTCQPCKDALAAYERSKYGKASGTHPRRRLAPCGTNAAYKRHRAHGEQPCEACRDAHAHDTALYNKANRIFAAMTRETSDA